MKPLALRVPNTALRIQGVLHHIATSPSHYRHDPLLPEATYRPGKHADQIMQDYYREAVLKALAATHRRRQ